MTARYKRQNADVVVKGKGVGLPSIASPRTNKGAIPKIICHAASIAGESWIDRALTTTLAYAALAAPKTTPMPPQKANGPFKPSSRQQITVTPPSATIPPASFCNCNGSSGNIQCAKNRPKIGIVACNTAARPDETCSSAQNSKV